MLTRRRNIPQRRGSAAPAANSSPASPGGGASDGASGGCGGQTDNAGGFGGEAAAVIEERLSAFGPSVLSSLIDANRTDDAAVSSLGEELGMGEVEHGEVAATSSIVQLSKRVAQAVLLLYLHIGNDPPDFPRVEPCAKLECWVDPLVAHVAQYGPHKRGGGSGSDNIAEALEAQYRVVLRDDVSVMRVTEASVDTARSVLSKVRRAARDDRVLVHYNGHGMPRATELGEVWMFDKEKTHYVPLNVLETADLVGSPAVYIFDCNAAGAILKRWQKERMPERRPNDLFICACGAEETLPLNPRLPADMLTACLTTPLRMALEWYIGFSQFKVLLPDVTEDMIRNMPGTLSDRRTPRGELNWILGALTTMIAWSTLPSSLFQTLFRQDTATKTLFRNAILADRLMREAGCAPVTHPKLSESAHLHPLWELWEYTLERTVCQLPRLASSTGAAPRGGPAGAPSFFSSTPADRRPEDQVGGVLSGLVTERASPLPATYEPSTFIEDQLTAFAVWVHSGDMSQLPEQLPCVLLALSQSSHQVRAFTLLSKYLDAGRTAGKRAILCGILPYLSRLLVQTPKAFLIVTVLWMQVIRADPVECCGEVQRTQCEKYFTSVLKLDERLTKVEPVEYEQCTTGLMNAPEAGAVANLLTPTGSMHAERGAAGGRVGVSSATSASTGRDAAPSHPNGAARQLQEPQQPVAAALPSGSRTSSSRNIVGAVYSDGDANSGSTTPRSAVNHNRSSAGDTVQQPVQPAKALGATNDERTGASAFPVPRLSSIATHAVQPGETAYYLMKEVDLARCKSMACYILCQFQLRGERQCLLCWNNRLLNAAFPNLSSSSAELRSWTCLVLSKLFSGLRHAKNFASRECASRLDLFTRLLQDRSPLVRSSCVTVLASVVGVRMDLLPADQQIRRLQMEKSLLIKLRGYMFDASMNVREELIFFASQLLFAYRQALPEKSVQHIHEYVVEVGQSSPKWELSEAEVGVKSLLNVARPTVNSVFDDAVVFETTFLTLDDPVPSPHELDPSRLEPEALATMKGLLHDAALMLCTLYQNCDANNVNKALRVLSNGEAPQSQRFSSETLRTMSRVASLDSAYYSSEADRSRMTWNTDVMRQLVLDLRGRKLEPPKSRTTLQAQPTPASSAYATEAAGDTPHATPPAAPSDSKSLHVDGHSSARAAAASAGTAVNSSSGTGSHTSSAALPDSTAPARHQILPSMVRPDTVVCTTFRALEAALVVATKNQRIHYLSYDSYSMQSVVNSFPVRLAGPIHDVLVINDLSEQSGLLVTTKRGTFSLMKGCWAKESIPTEAAVFSACPPPPPNTWLDIKTAYRPNTATLFYGGPIGSGDNAGGTEIHMLSLAEEHVTQQLQVSGNPSLTGLVAHTTQRPLFAAFADGVVRYYDDRQRQGHMGTVGMMLCRPLPGTPASAPPEAVVGLGLVVPDLCGDVAGNSTATPSTLPAAAASGGAAFTLAAATRSALYIFDARKLTDAVLTVSHKDLYVGTTPASNTASAAVTPFITNCCVGEHTGLVALSFSNGSYAAYNAKGLILTERPTAVSSAKQPQQPQIPLPLPLSSSCVAHPLRPLMSFGGDLMFLQV